MSRTSLYFIPLLLTCLAVPSSLRAQRGAGTGGRSSGGVIDVQVRYGMPMERQGPGEFTCGSRPPKAVRQVIAKQ